MTITVYIWLPHTPSDGTKRVGHGSMKLSNGTYISWWPAGGKGSTPKVTGTTERTLQMDEIDEGGPPHYTINIPPRIRLNEDKMESWWDQFKVSGTWNVVTNCCWVIEEALIKGGVEKYLKVKGLIHFSHPNQLLALLQRIQAVNVDTGSRIVMTSLDLEREALENALDKVLNGTSGTDVFSKFTFT